MPKPKKSTSTPKPAAKKTAPGAASLTVQGRLTLGGAVVRCPSRGAGNVPRTLTLMISGGEVHATCGERHPPEGQRRASRNDPKCMFALSQLSPATLRTVATKSEPGRRFSFKPVGGPALEGKRARAALSVAATGAGPGASAHAARAVAAGSPRSGRAAPAGRSGGTVAAGLNTVTAVAQAFGQTAGAAGAAISSTAGAAGKLADLGSEGMRTGRAAIKAVDNAGARRFARDNRATDDEGGGKSGK